MCLDENKENAVVVATRRAKTSSCPQNDLECDDLIPIQIACVGEWRPVSSSNMITFLQRRQSTRYYDILFRLGSHRISFFGGKFHFLNLLKNEKAFETIGYLGQQSEKQKSVVVTVIKNNKFVTSTFWKEKWGIAQNESEERFIKNGQLHIVNYGFGCSCIRVYDRVEVFDMGISTAKPIEEELMGVWKKWAHTGLREFSRCLSLDHNLYALWENGCQSFKFLEKNRIFINHFLAEEPYLSEFRDVALRQPIHLGGRTWITSFEDNTLVTLESDRLTGEMISRVVRFVLDGKLFVVKYQGGYCIFVVYERMTSE